MFIVLCSTSYFDCEDQTRTLAHQHPRILASTLAHRHNRLVLGNTKRNFARGKDPRSVFDLTVNSIIYNYVFIHIFYQKQVHCWHTYRRETCDIVLLLPGIRRHIRVIKVPLTPSNGHLGSVTTRVHVTH